MFGCLKKMVELIFPKRISFMQSEKAEIANQFMLSVRFIAQCTFEMLHIL